MSSIDQRVAKMELDNAQFEKAAEQTISTLNSLDKSLQLKNADTGLRAVEQAAKQITLQSLADSVAAIQDRFSAFGTFASRIFEKLADDAYAAAKKVAAEFTLEPIKTGFEEYETQMNAVQTILANTSAKGSTLEDVNDALSELNTYADKTIYNFTEMTRNIGTFTAAGVDLDTSVSAIKGIANLAAVSGSTSQQASTAMYQLSQALSAGTLKLQDWNSVVNAGMGGQIFQDALKETAKLHGVAIDEMIKKEGSFRETLSEGWITSQILTETLEKFTGDLSESQLRQMGYSEEQIKSIVEMGQTANDAATKVKTFTQLFDTLKEATQSGWTTTWQIIVGDFEEAKTLLTEVSDVFGGIIGEASDARNKLLEGALGNASRVVDEFGALVKVSLDDTGIQEALIKATGPHEEAVRKLIEENGSFEASLHSGWLTADVLNKAIGTLTIGIDEQSEVWQRLGGVADDVLSGKYGAGEEIMKNLTAAGYDYNEVQNVVIAKMLANGEAVGDLTDEQIEAIGYTREQVNALKELANQSEQSGESVFNLVSQMFRPSGRELIIDIFRNALTGLGKVLGAIKEAWENVFPPMTSEQLYNIIEKIYEFSRGLIASDDTIEKFKATFQGIFSVLKIGTDFLKILAGGAVEVVKRVAPLGGVFLNATAKLGSFLTTFQETGMISTVFREAMDKAVVALDFIIAKFKEVVETVKQKFAIPAFDFLAEKFSGFNGGISNVKENFVNAIASMKQNAAEGSGGIANAFAGIKEKINKVLEPIRKIADKIKELLSPLWEKIKGAWSGVTFTDILGTGMLAGLLGQVKSFVSGFGKIVTSFGEIAGAVKESLDTAKESLEMWQKDLKADMLLKIALSVGILAASLALISLVDYGKIITGTAAIGAFSYMLVKVMKELGSENIKVSAEKAGEMVILALAMSLLGSALGKLSETSWDKIAVGAAGLSALMIVLSGTALALSDSMGSGVNFIATAAGLVVFASAINKLSKSLVLISTIPWEVAKDGLKTMAGIFAELAVFAKLTSGIQKGASCSLEVALALLVMYEAVKLYADLDMYALQKGGTAVAAFMLIAGAASGLARAGGGKAGGTVMSLALAMLALVVPIKLMSDLIEENEDAFQKATLYLGGLMVVMAAVIAIMGGATKAKALANLTPVLLSMSVAVLSLAEGLKMLSGIDAGNLRNSLIALGVALGAFVIAAYLLTPIAPTLMVVSGALALFGVAILTISAGLITLVGLFNTIAVSAPLVSGAIITTMAAIASGIVLGFTTALTSLIAGLAEIGSAIIVFGPIIFKALNIFLLNLIGTIQAVGPALIETVAILLLSLIQAIATRAPEFTLAAVQIINNFLIGLQMTVPTLIETGTVMLSAFLDGIMANTEKIVETAVGLITTFLEGIASTIDVIVETAFTIISRFLQAIAEHAPEFVTTAVTLIVAFIQGITEAIPQIVQSALTMIVSFLQGIRDNIGDIVTVAFEIIEEFIKAIGENTVNLINAGFEMIINFLNGLADAIRENLPIVIEAATNVATAIIDGLISGLTGGVTKLWDEVSSIGGKVIDKFKDVFGIASPARVMRDEVGGNIMSGLSLGISKDKSATKSAEKQSKGILGVFDKYASRDEAKKKGKAVTDGVSEGIKEGTTSTKKASKAMATETVEAAEEEIELKLMKDDLGHLFVQGIANGIEEDMSAEEAAAKKAENIGNAFKEVFDKFDLTQSIDDLEYELWSEVNAEADEEQQAMAKLTNAANKVKTFQEEAALAISEYNYTVEQLGEGSIEATNAYKKMLQAEIDLAKQRNELKKTKDEYDESYGEGPSMDELLEARNAYFDYGSELSTSTANGMLSGDEEFYNSALKLTDTALAAFQTQNGPGYQAGADLSSNYIAGLSSNTNNSVVAATTLAAETVNGAGKNEQDWVSLGRDCVRGFADGITNSSWLAENAAAAAARNALAAAQQQLDSHSPSRKFMELGKFCNEGLAIGLERSKGVVSAASKEIANIALYAAENLLEAMDGDVQPTVRPVIDLSNVKMAATQIDSMFAQTNPTLGVAYGGYDQANLLAMREAAIRNRTLEEQTVGFDDSDIIREVRALGDRFGALVQTLSGMKVVMNTGETVGALQVPMDRSLGMRSRLAARGV